MCELNTQKTPEKSQSEENVPNWDERSIWLDCPINKVNRFYFMLANLLTALALFFGINLSKLACCQKANASQLLQQNYAVDVHCCSGIFHHLE